MGLEKLIVRKLSKKRFYSKAQENSSKANFALGRKKKEEK